MVAEAFMGGDEARKRMDEVKFRNRGGNMEEIQGFNLTYNDGPAHVEVEHEQPFTSTLESEAARRARNERDSAAFFQHTSARRAAKKAGKLEHSNVLQAASARKDHRALRAKDGQPIKLPYRVVLKQSVHLL